MPEGPPNILFLMTDQQRHDALGRVQPIVKTPHLDRLASDGLHFTHAYCTNPSCVPSRAAILTGKWPSQCGAPTYITHMFDHEVPFARRLQQAGYYTAVFGRQHFGTSKTERGYDEQTIVDVAAPAKQITNQDDDPYHRFLSDRGVKGADELILPVKDVPHTDRWIADPELFIDQFVGERGLQWLRDRRPTDQPWYCKISFPGPHSPYNALGLEEAALYDPEDIPIPDSSHEDWVGKPPHWSAYSSFSRHPEHKDILTDPRRRTYAIRTMRHAYWANVSLIDRQIGAILDCLRTAGEYERTLIVFTSDHGDFQGEFSMPLKGQYLAEALMRVPLIVKPPIVDFAGRQVTESFASTVDIAPTLLSVAGITVPDEVVGCDLAKWWAGHDEHPIQEDAYMEAQQLRGLRHGPWKLVYYRDRLYGELYNLEGDPSERVNLWNLPEYQPVKQMLICRLVNRMIAITPRSEAVWNYGNPDV